MKNLMHLFVAMLATLVMGCSNGNQNKQAVEVKRPLPQGAVEMDCQRHLVCQVMLRDSVPARMIFDTGATHLLLDSTFYAHTFADGGNLRKAMVGGAGGGMETVWLDASPWHYRVGEESQQEDMAMIVNLRKIVGERVDGMFGMIFMRGKRVEFNYADGYLRPLPAQETIGDDYTRIPCQWLDESKTRILLPLVVTLEDGSVFEGRFLMDTGMPDAFALNRSTAHQLKKEGHLADARGMSYAVGGIGGSRRDYVFKAAQIDFGGHVIKGVRATWSDNQQGSLASADYDGLVGNQLFDRFDVIIDFVDCVVYVRPNRNFDRPQPHDFGIALTPKADHWWVNALLEGGNAQKAGLRQGDCIEQINGVRITDPAAKNLYPLPQTLTFLVRRGDELVEMVVESEL